MGEGRLRRETVEGFPLFVGRRGPSRRRAPSLPIGVIQEFFRAHTDRRAGGARTHARRSLGRSLHMSHFTAFFIWSFCFTWVSRPGSSVRPVSSHAHRLAGRRFGS